MVTRREKDIQDSIKLLEGEMAAMKTHKRTDLVECVFNDQEKWVPPGYEHTDHFIWRKMPKSPNKINGKIYSIPKCELGTKSNPINPWWERV